MFDCILEFDIWRHNIPSRIKQRRKKFLPPMKILSLLSNEKFCPFSKFQNSSKKTQLVYFFRDSPFLYHKNNKKKEKKKERKKKKTYSTFQQSTNRSFHFRPDHFAIVFLDILIIRIVNLRWLSLFLWFHHLSIFILLYYDFDCFFVLNFCWIIVLSLKVPRVKWNKNVLGFLVC